LNVSMFLSNIPWKPDGILSAAAEMETLRSGTRLLCVSGGVIN